MQATDGLRMCKSDASDAGGPAEQAFRIFYHVALGASDEHRARWMLGPSRSYNFTNEDEAGLPIPLGQDEAEHATTLEGLLAAMGRLGMSLDDQEEFMRVVVGALHLTQIEFAVGSNDAAKIADEGPLHKCAELWGVEEAALASSILNKEKKFGKEVNLLPLPPESGKFSSFAIGHVKSKV